MAKSITPSGVTLTYPATTAYKQWVRAQLKARKWTQQKLVDEMKRIDRSLTTISTATITDFLGPEEFPPVPSNSKLLPAINRVLGIAPPPVCDPNDDMQQLVERFRARWKRATPTERAVLLAVLGGDNESSPVE